jgi:hypothetical protein
VNERKEWYIERHSFAMTESIATSGDFAMYDDGEEEEETTQTVDQDKGESDEEIEEVTTKSKEEELFELAAEQSDETLEKVKALMETGNIDIEARNNFGLTPLQVEWNIHGFQQFKKGFFMFIYNSLLTLLI